jgi:hypothetical protein
MKNKRIFMYKKFALFLSFTLLNCNNLIAADAQINHDQDSSYVEFVNNYTELFGEKPGSEWDELKPAGCIVNGNGGRCPECGN